MPTVLFDLRRYAFTVRCSEDLLYQWSRQFKGVVLSQKKPTILTQEQHENLLNHLEVGIACRFDQTRYQKYRPIQQKLVQAKAAVERCVDEKQRLAAAIAHHDAKLLEGANLPARIFGLTDKINKLKQHYERKKMLALLKVDSNYQTLNKEKNQLTADLLVFAPEQLATSRANIADLLRRTEAEKVKLGAAVQELKEQGKAVLFAQAARTTVANSPRAAAPTSTLGAAYSAPTQSDQTIQVDWQNVQFGNGSILVSYRGQFLNSFPLPESRRFLNAVKAHYKFRNAPLLQLLINGRHVLKVLNREVLFFYIQLLTDTGSYFESEPTVRPLSISRFSAFNHQYYQKHLPNLFQNKSLEYLCQLADTQACIIPTPELVINSKGSTSIDDSFLFPIKCHQQHYIAWESVEESKATYLFRTVNNGLLKNLQLIYDYLVGPTVNKRTHLIGSPVIQSQTGFVSRVNHTYFSEWKAEIHARCQMMTSSNQVRSDSPPADKRAREQNASGLW